MHAYSKLESLDLAGGADEYAERVRSREETARFIASVKLMHRKMDLSDESKAELERRRLTRWEAERPARDAAALARLFGKPLLEISESDLTTLGMRDRLQIEMKILMARHDQKEVSVNNVYPFPAPPPTPEMLPDLIKTSGEFIGDFVPPDYLVDGILERRYFYAITAQTGVGKTAAAMLLTAFVAAGRPIGNIEVEKGTVLYMAGENPTDVQKRWLGVTHYFGMDPAALDVHFIAGSMDLSQHAERITAEVVQKNLKPSLVVVDTAAAYNFGDDENSNSQAGNYARLLRTLTTLPGGPCVIVLCHPTKSASDPSELLPRGGGAFLAELDGNIPLARNDTLLVATPGKMRGSTGWTLRFELEVIRNHPKLRDVKGRQLSTIVARPVDEAAEERGRSRSRTNEDAVLRHLDKAPGSSPTDVAKALSWTYGVKNEANRTLALRTLERLGKAKPALVKQTRGDTWHLTPAGQVALNDLDRMTPPLPPIP